MRRTTKFFIYICVAGLAALYACSDKETPQPVVDSARLDALRQELRDLRAEVLGLQADYSYDSLTETDLKAEIAKLNIQYSKTVDYSVIVTDLQGNTLSGATVKVTQGGVVKSGTTDANGLVTFNAMHGGNIPATVALNGFATLIYTADVTDDNTSSSFSGSTHVSLIPVDGSVAAAAKGMFTVNIDLYANYNVLDDTLGGPDYWDAQSNIAFALPYGPDGGPTSYSKVTDKTITVSLRTNDFQYYYNDWFTTDGVGRVFNIAYENAIVKATAAGANGTYSIKIPAATPNRGFYYTLTFQEFAHDFTQLVPGVGGSVHIKAPYSKTYTVSQVYRSNYDSYEYAAQLGTTYNWKYFYSPSNN